MADDAKRLLLLCHDGGWDRLYQAASAAATATSTGWQVDVVFYFDALRRLLDGTLDEAGDDARLGALVDAADERGVQPPSALFEAARATGSCRFLACSASLGLIGRDPTDVDAASIDEVIGWPTTLALLEQSDRALYL